MYVGARISLIQWLLHMGSDKEGNLQLDARVLASEIVVGDLGRPGRSVWKRR